jgi:hypothetical protein
MLERIGIDQTHAAGAEQIAEGQIDHRATDGQPRSSVPASTMVISRKPAKSDQWAMDIVRRWTTG